MRHSNYEGVVKNTNWIIIENVAAVILVLLIILLRVYVFHKYYEPIGIPWWGM